MNNVEIKFDKESRDVYLRVNYSEWIVKSWDELTEYERILIRSLAYERTEFDIADIPF